MSARGGRNWPLRAKEGRFGRVAGAQLGVPVATAIDRHELGDLVCRGPDREALAVGDQFAASECWPTNSVTRPVAVGMTLITVVATAVGCVAPIPLRDVLATFELEAPQRRVAVEKHVRR